MKPSKNRYEVKDKMYLGLTFEITRNLSAYNNKLIKFWMNQFNYNIINHRHGYNLLTPPHSERMIDKVIANNNSSSRG